MLLPRWLKVKHAQWAQQRYQLGVFIAEVRNHRPRSPFHRVLVAGKTLRTASQCRLMPLPRLCQPFGGQGCWTGVVTRPLPCRRTSLVAQSPSRGGGTGEELRPPAASIPVDEPSKCPTAAAISASPKESRPPRELWLGLPARPLLLPSGLTLSQLSTCTTLPASDCRAASAGSGCCWSVAGGWSGGSFTCVAALDGSSSEAAAGAWDCCQAGADIIPACNT